MRCVRVPAQRRRPLIVAESPRVEPKGLQGFARCGVRYRHGIERDQRSRSHDSTTQGREDSPTVGVCGSERKLEPDGQGYAKRAGRGNEACYRETPRRSADRGAACRQRRGDPVTTRNSLGSTIVVIGGIYGTVVEHIQLMREEEQSNRSIDYFVAHALDHALNGAVPGPAAVSMTAYRAYRDKTESGTA